MTRYHQGRAAGPPMPHLSSGDRLYEELDRPVRRRPRRSAAARLKRTLLSGLFVVALAGGAYVLQAAKGPDGAGVGDAQADVRLAEDAAVPATPGLDAAVARPIWIRASAPVPVFSLAASGIGPGFGDRERSYEAQHHGLGGQEDIIGIGRFATPGPHLRLSVYRPGGEAGTPSSFFVDMVRAASEAGLAVSRTSVPRGVTTKLGTMEVAEAQLVGHGVVRSCSAFRLLHAAPALRLSGWVCGADDRPRADAALRCVIDGLEPAASLDDGGLKALFHAARPAATCGAAPRVAEEALAADGIAELLATSADVPLPPVRPASFGRT
ncbi:hypothetical protein Ga0061061_10630 [Chelatococcus sambhunathii]|uniref:Uncharacterized protein n=1 Tax=Chelatococcus sambhunathii TaxID=363953 RepID=A0ABP2A9K8_9HYPH|nr:hypothetical protein [Chelatococcus sambhunathii]CUA88937.1 hypothetical protein Ga0061061_10630 [Chelatococcus sambhunathii]